MDIILYTGHPTPITYKKEEFNLNDKNAKNYRNMQNMYNLDKNVLSNYRSGEANLKTILNESEEVRKGFTIYYTRYFYEPKLKKDVMQFKFKIGNFMIPICKRDIKDHCEKTKTNNGEITVNSIISRKLGRVNNIFDSFYMFEKFKKGEKLEYVLDNTFFKLVEIGGLTYFIKCEFSQKLGMTFIRIPYIVSVSKKILGYMEERLEENDVKELMKKYLGKNAN